MKISQSQLGPDGDPKTCDRCGRHRAMHTEWEGDKTSHLCCACYVEGGGPPADWHPLCMETYAKIKAGPPAGAS